ncbi:head-tail connector protein [Pseudomonas sp. GWSMS-1]|uniref:head-tail connector protein n=1 Tax=Pseudomonas sp. GWSMS-1 TaxID=3308997 RepID=UPI003CEBC898
MIALAAVKAHLRVEHDDEDTMIQGYIDGAISAFEVWTNRKLVADEASLPEPIGNALVISKSIQQGALMLIGHWYANAESVVIGTITAELPFATHALWQPHRWMNI